MPMDPKDIETAWDLTDFLDFYLEAGDRIKRLDLTIVTDKTFVILHTDEDGHVIGGTYAMD